MPKRIQMTRQKPWRAANPDAVIVARPTWWGNPYIVRTDRAEAVVMFMAHALNTVPFTTERIRADLGGRDLACWCPLDEPCHADVLLAIANPN